MRQLVIVLVLILALASSASAQLPFAVTPTKVVLEGDVPVDLETQGFSYVNGLPSTDGNADDGAWTDIRIDGLHYKLTFWNVGALGGTKGSWFWKTDYKDADLTISYNVADNGVIWEKQGEFNGMPTFRSDPAEEEPEFRSIHYRLRFSGSPTGNFEEVPPYKNKANKPLTGAIYGWGTYALFQVPIVTAQESSKYGENTNPPLMEYFSDKELRIDGNPWFGWPEGSVGCEGGGDSGVRFADMDGQVEVYPDSDPEDSRLATMDDVLEVCDHIVTEDDSWAKISFADMTSFRIGPESNFVLVKPQGPKSKFSLVAGKIWANVKRMVNEGEMDIDMNQAVAGIKGTTFVLEETQDGSTLKVIEGSVEFTSKTTGKSETVNSGEQATADKNGLQEKEAFNIGKETETWDNMSSPAELSKENYFGFAFVLAVLLGLLILFRKKFFRIIINK